jgi:hypothetical protein
MKAACLLPLCAVLLLGGPGRAARGDDLPAAARETLDAFEKEIGEVQRRAEEVMRKAADKAAAQLKLLQDKFCKEAKLDEAVAIRDQVRQLQGGPDNPNAADLPAAAKEVLDGFHKEEAELQKKAKAEMKKVREKTAGQLKAIQDKFCKEAKLDEAVAVRDALRIIQSGVTNAQPDPGLFSATADEIGKVRYFELVGNTNGQTWGTDVYTTDSHLATSAVHAGVLRVGQKGIVKVTVLPGLDNYMATTRNGVTSQPWGNWGVSFKVERAFGIAAAPPKE